jgi:hypothetical protein
LRLARSRTRYRRGDFAAAVDTCRKLRKRVGEARCSRGETRRCSTSGTPLQPRNLGPVHMPPATPPPAGIAAHRPLRASPSSDHPDTAVGSKRGCQRLEPGMDTANAIEIRRLPAEVLARHP